VTLRLTVRHESWPIAGGFRLSRGAKSSAEVVVVELGDAGLVGRGECVPYPRYGESGASVIAAVEATRGELEDGADRARVAAALPAGAARNAIDCALWDLDARRRGTTVWRLAGLPEPRPFETCLTLDLGDPVDLRARAAAQAGRRWLKVKVGAPGDLTRLRAVHEAAPGAQLVVDANEGWTPADLEAVAPELGRLGVSVLEQPLPAGEDAALADVRLPVPICADESFHSAGDVRRLAGRYDAVNLKLDKAGGLTAALAARDAARAAGLRVMVGCMVGTSLAMAPAVLLAQDADFVDLDGPLLLARDRKPALHYYGATVSPPAPALWG